MKNAFPKTIGQFTLASHSVLFSLIVTVSCIFFIFYSRTYVFQSNSFYAAILFTGVVLSCLLIFLNQSSRIINNTDEKRASAELALSKIREALVVKEVKYSNLVENSGLIIYTINLEGIFTFVSEKAVELTGFPLSELKGMHYSQLICPDTKRSVLETYKKQVEENIEETTIDFCIKTKQGQNKCVEQSAVLIKNNDGTVGLQCIIKDISERKEMENILKKYEQLLIQNQDRLQSILDNATSMIYIKDLEGKYILVNKKFKEVLKLSDEDIIGRTDLEIASPGQYARFNETDLQVKQTGTAMELEEEIKIGDKKLTLLITKFPLLDGQNKIYGISGIATDITERVIYQQQLIEARLAAEDAKSMQEQFLANMSHEIRTPMNGIQGMTHLLLETNLNSEQHDYAKTIKTSSDNLLVIINDILDFSKIKAGKLTLEKIDFKLDEVLDNVKATFKHRVIEKGIALQVSIDNNVPDILNGDPYRLNQILINLIGNAIKFTSKGEVAITASAEKVNDDLHLQFVVKDTGIGIEEDKIAQIFESFTQASIETSRKYGGTGLGLSITKQLLDLQGGKIEVNSIPAEGTTFTFSLPYGYQKTETPLLFAGKDVEKNQVLLQGKRFLVAEDNLVNQKVICHVLRKAGGLVDVANNGLEAIAFLNDAKTYHLIIMDLQMPEMDGYAATKYIRNVMNLSIPIIAMTASAVLGQKELCLGIGMNDYVSKPFDFANIYKRICLLIDEDKVKELPIDAEKPNGLLFDLGMLEELDDDAYMSDILHLFLSNTREAIIEIKSAIERDTPDKVIRLAHKLKSSTGLLKISKMSAILDEIEDKARKYDNQTVTGMVDQLELEYNKVAPPIMARLTELHEKSLITT